MRIIDQNAWAALRPAGDALRCSQDALRTILCATGRPESVLGSISGRFGVPRSLFREGFGSMFASMVASWRARFGKPTTRLAKQYWLAYRRSKHRSCYYILQDRVLHASNLVCIFIYNITAIIGLLSGSPPLGFFLAYTATPSLGGVFFSRLKFVMHFLVKKGLKWIKIYRSPMKIIGKSQRIIYNSPL